MVSTTNFVALEATLLTRSFACFGLAVLVLDFTHAGLPLVVRSSSRSDAVIFAIDSLHIDVPLSPRSPAHLGPFSIASRLARTRLLLLALDCVLFGTISAIRSFA